MESGSAMAALKAEYGPTPKPEAWEQDLSADRLVLESHGRKPWRLLVSEYCRTKDHLTALQAAAGKSGAIELLAMVNAVQSHRQDEAEFGRHSTLGAELFGGSWQGRDSDWPRLTALTQWFLELHNDVSGGRMPQGI